MYIQSFCFINFYNWFFFFFRKLSKFSRFPNIVRNLPIIVSDRFLNLHLQFCPIFLPWLPYLPFSGPWTFLPETPLSFFSRNKLLVWLTLCIITLFSSPLIAILIFMISFLLLSFACSVVVLFFFFYCTVLRT